MGSLFLVLACVLVFFLFCLVLIRYGEKNQKAKNTEVELKVAKQNMEASRKVALDTPVSDDDVLARLRGNKDS